MHRLIWFVIVMAILSGCESKRNALVGWKPEAPRAGETLEIYYNPAFPTAKIAEPQEIHIIFESIFPESTQVQVLPLEERSGLWFVKVNIASRARVIGFKFEDQNGLTEDNSSGWNLPVSDEKGKPQEDSWYFLGKIFDSSLRPGTKPDLNAALQAYQNELNIFPENYKAWLGVWQTKLLLHPKPAEQLPSIGQQLDSLISLHPNHPDILRLAFDTYRSILSNTPKAVYFGSRYLTENPSGEKNAQIAFLLILLQNETQPEKLIRELDAYLANTTGEKHRLAAYVTLLENYLRLRDHDQAFQLLNKIVALNPADFSYYVSLARYLGENGQPPEAEKKIEEAFAKCTLLASQLNEPWLNGFQRLIQLNIDLAGIHSALARINFNDGKLEKSIRNRKKAIELGSPFPGYEWQLIGRAYSQMNKYENAKHAYAEALLIDPYFETAIQDLFVIFQREQMGSSKKFDEYVRELLDTHQQEFAKPAPEFEILDANGKVFSLANQKGKITVIYFGATMLWDANPGLLHELNQLTEHFQSVPEIDFWLISLESKHVVENYLAKQPLGFKIFTNGERARDVFNIPGFPTYLIIDQKGLEQFRQVGESGPIGPILEKKIREILNQPLS